MSVAADECCPGLTTGLAILGSGALISEKNLGGTYVKLTNGICLV